MKIGIASADYLRADKSTTGKDQWGGAGWARLGQYLPYLRAAGHEVTCGTLWDNTSGMSIEDAEGNFVEPDVVILQRIMHDKVSKTMRKGQAKGQIVLNEIDDWYWNLDPRNEAWKATHPKYNPTENIEFYKATVKQSDMVLCSTPYIADQVKQKFGVPSVVLPNHVDVSRFTPVEQQEKPTFGWTGSTSHRSGDLEQLKGLFGRYIRSGRINMQHSGDMPGAEPFHNLVGLADEDVTRMRGANVLDYPSLMCFDVGLVPLRDIPFNHAKSDIKGLEYAAAGMPFIASPSPSYNELHKHWDGLFPLAKKPKDWLKAIEYLVPLQTRIEIQQELLERIKERDIERGAYALTQTLEGLA